MRTVPFKTFLVPVPFPLVTTFETTGTYKKWLWPNSAYITYTWHALLLWHTYLHTYIYIYIRTASAQISTPLIVSRSFRSLANYDTHTSTQVVDTVDDFYKKARRTRMINKRPAMGHQQSSLQSTNHIISCITTIHTHMYICTYICTYSTAGPTTSSLFYSVPTHTFHLCTL